MKIGRGGFLSLIKQNLSLLTIEGKTSDPTTLSATGPSSPELSLASVAQQAQIELQPGNSTVKTFTVRTRWTIFFPPASYNLYLWIDYDIDDERNKDAVRYTLSIRSPLRAIILGSVAGSTIGFVIRSISDHHGAITYDFQSISLWLIQLVGNVLLASIAVIAFARKKDTQPILSIEDFWGGLFIGFLAGYTGKTFINQFHGAGRAGIVQLCDPMACTIAQRVKPRVALTALFGLRFFLA